MNVARLTRKWIKARGAASLMRRLGPGTAVGGRVEFGMAASGNPLTWETSGLMSGELALIDRFVTTPGSGS